MKRGKYNWRTWLCSLSLLLALTVGIALISAPAQATSITVHADISLTAEVADFDAGHKTTGPHLVSWTWTEGGSWKVTIQSLDADLGTSDDGTYTKPLSDLKWKRSVATTWNTMSMTPATVRTGTASSSYSNQDYRFLLSWFNDKPGSYGATIQYTITSL